MNARKMEYEQPMGLGTRTKLNSILLYSGFPEFLRFVQFSPEWVNIRVTENCNSRCMTCYAWKNKSACELNTEEIKNALYQLSELGAGNVIFIGGEPLLRNDIGILVKEASSLNFKNIIVVTNGLLLEKKAAELLTNGVTHITVSVDGIGTTNDMIRGVPGSYEKSIRGIKTVKKLMKDKGLNVSVTILTTILLNQNVDEIPKLIEVTRDLDVHWLFNLLDPNVDFFKGIPFSELLVKSEEKIDRTIDYLKNTLIEYPGLISSCNHMLDYASNYLKGKKRYDFHCIHGYKMIYLGSHGEVYPGCWVMEPIGNIRDQKLSDIIGSKRHIEVAKRMYMMKCPGCTNRYEINIEMKHLIPHFLHC